MPGPSTKQWNHSENRVAVNIQIWEGKPVFPNSLGQQHGNILLHPEGRGTFNPSTAARSASFTRECMSPSRILEGWVPGTACLTEPYRLPSSFLLEVQKVGLPPQKRVWQPRLRVNTFYSEDNKIACTLFKTNQALIKISFTAAMIPHQIS